MSLALNGARTTLEQIQSQWPSIRTIAIAYNMEQEHEAQAVDADSVLLSGFQATKLIAVIEELLSQRKGD